MMMEMDTLGTAQAHNSLTAGLNHPSVSRRATLTALVLFIISEELEGE